MTESGSHQLEKISRGVQLYLARSGSLPISFNITVALGVDHELEQWTTVMMIFQILFSVCHRWEEARFQLSDTTFERLGCLKAQLPMLTTLAVKMYKECRPPAGPFNGLGISFPVLLDYRM